MNPSSKFDRLGTENAPGQEVRLKTGNINLLAIGPKLAGDLVDFSHGDVNAFEPTPRSFDAFTAGVELGGQQAYTEYRGSLGIREYLSERLASFTGAPIAADRDIIITPGTQGALFLAMASTIAKGDKVAIIDPDYFANRKLVQFLEGDIVPVQLDYERSEDAAGLDLEQLEAAFKAGAKVFVFSNPNNPTGAVYSAEEVQAIARLATRYDATVIVDQLYSRLTYEGTEYSHLRAQDIDPEMVVTIMGPSKTESLSGYRLGTAFGSAQIIERMEKLQAIVSLRAAGYSQSVLRTWFSEPRGWLEERIAQHQAIRNDLLKIFRSSDGFSARAPQAGSYLFPKMSELRVSDQDFVRLLRHQASVIVTPGAEFSLNRDGHIRLNFSQSHHAALAAVTRLVTLAERYSK